MKNKISIIIFIVIFISGCSEPYDKKITIDLIEITSDFNLENDHLKFSSEMNEIDTLEILVDLSACLNFHIEKNILTKKEGEIFIQSIAVGDIIEEKDEELEMVRYKRIRSDTLNFEDFFNYLKKKDTVELAPGHAAFSMVYGADTITYFSHDLNDHLHNIAYYMLIKQRLHPEIKTYQPIYLL